MRILALSILLVCSAGPLAAQAPGDSVRVTTASADRARALVLRREPDALVLLRPDTQRVPLADIRRLEVRTASQRPQYAVLLGALGVALGYVLPLPKGRGETVLAGPDRVFAMLGGGMTGALLGSGFGRGPRWRDVPIAPPAQ